MPNLRSQQAQTNNGQYCTRRTPGKSRHADGHACPWNYRVRAGQHSTAVNQAASRTDQGHIFIVDRRQVDSNTRAHQRKDEQQYLSPRTLYLSHRCAFTKFYDVSLLYWTFITMVIGYCWSAHYVNIKHYLKVYELVS